MTLWTKLNRAFGDFRKARAGNVALTFALATVPIIGTVGFAVDYSHANSVKAAMQAALEFHRADAVAGSGNGYREPVADKCANLFQRAVHAAGSHECSDQRDLLFQRRIEPGRKRFSQRPTTFLGIIGYNYIPVNGSSTSKWGSSRLRVALALDNTGSMADDGKITALKSATTNLLAQLQSAAGTDGDVYVSIIPFSRDVNVGPTATTTLPGSTGRDWARPRRAQLQRCNLGPGDNCP